MSELLTHSAAPWLCIQKILNSDNRCRNWRV